MEGINTLANLRRDQDHQIASLNSKQKLKIGLYEGESYEQWKGFRGEGETEANFTFNVDEGRINGSETRSQIKVVTLISTAPSKLETSLEMQLTMKSSLIGQ